MPATPATPEAEAGGWKFETRLDKVSTTLYQKQNKQRGDMLQLVEHLPSSTRPWVDFPRLIFTGEKPNKHKQTNSTGISHSPLPTSQVRTNLEIELKNPSGLG
jgi:hypothetical protein